MYIKKIIIDGFKSYQHKAVIEFDPRHNAIIGENGSGKSSLLLAIQFVLSRKSISLTRNEQPTLLNRNCRIKYASVEIIFDNSDKQLIVDKESVSVKRSISIKSDQFFLNGKVISADDISTILETAGFYKSTSQYIIKQREIAEISIKPEKRLQLLHELAGTNLYNDNQEDILTTLHDIEMTMKNIQELLDGSDEKGKILKRNAEYLREYKNLYKQQQAIEFLIQEKIIQENQNYLNILEIKANDLNKAHENQFNNLQIMQEDIKKIDIEITKFKKQNRKFQAEKNMFDSEEEKFLLENNRLVVKKVELIKDMKEENEKYQTIDNQLQKLNNLINEKEKKLERIKSQWETKMNEEESIKIKLDSDERDYKELCRKQGRGLKFKNKEERDLWIKQELQRLEKQIASYNNNKFEVEQKIADDNRNCNFLEKNIEILETEVINLEKKCKDYRVELLNLKTKNAELLIFRNELFKENSNLTDESNSLKHDNFKLEQTLKSLFGQNLIDGKNSVEKVLEIFKANENMKERLSEYHGLVIDNFDCNSEIFKAVEETAGKQLFYHIVQTSLFGNEILKEINRQQLPGEITFLPLDCLKVRDVSYSEYKEAESLISQLNYNEKYENPLRQIFGKTLICTDLEVAATIASKSDFDCMTLVGDKVTSTGLVKGGYFYNLYSPMKIESEIIGKSKNISLLNEKLSNLNKEINKNDNDISTYVNKQQNIEVEIDKISKIISDKKSEINLMKKELHLKHTSAITNKNNFKEYERQLNFMLESQQNLGNEFCNDVTENLSIHDQQLIENLIDSITQLKKKLEKINNERINLEYEKNKLETELNETLNCQKKELVEMKENIAKSSELIQESLTLLNDEFKLQEPEMTKNKDFIKKHEIKANTLREQQKDAVLKKQKLSLEEEKLFTDNAVVTAKLEKVNSKIAELKKTINDSSKIKSKLATPNAYFLKKFNKMNRKKLFKMLKSISEKLSAYDQRCKSALDELNVYNKKIDQLHDRKKELDKAYISFQHLLKVLEEKKCNNIQLLFNQVSKNFTDIFETLVPNSNAYLILKTADLSNSRNSTETVNKSVDMNNFLGIDIMATFTRSMEAKEIDYLSEGQKSFLSIVFMFAIQKSHPTPIYLFDEIDQALDPFCREQIVNMILQHNAQFISTSFHSDYTKHAKKFHRITFKNGMSQVQTITRDDAITFLKNRKTV